MPLTGRNAAHPLHLSSTFGPSQHLGILAKAVSDHTQADRAPTADEDPTSNRQMAEPWLARPVAVVELVLARLR